MAPKDRNPTDPTGFGPGMKTDGTVVTMTLEEARIARAERDGEEEAWNDEDDDLSDLEDIEEIADGE